MTDLAEFCRWWAENGNPRRFPEFDLSVSDGCTGVRQVARHACIKHDCRYWYGSRWRDKWHADWWLALDIWAFAHAETRPLSAYPAWWGLGMVRFIGVLALGNRAFWGKPHKRGLRRRI